MSDIISIHVSLKETNPIIWRRILVDISNTFSKLHDILQITMGWDGGHLYEFEINGFRIGVPQKDDFGWGEELINASKKTIQSVISGRKIKFKYIYDFGDNWEHSIKVEKYFQKIEGVNYPICIDGERNCPPEDCGGVWGFYDLLEAVKDKNHPEHNNMVEWLGEDYNPDFFDVKAINNRLGNLKSRKKFVQL